MDSDARRPTLVVIGGRPGTGKTTLAHLIARAIPCPVISRDEIKEGMAHTYPAYVAEPGDALTRRAFPLFFEVLRLLVEGGASVVAEAAFTHSVWAPQLERFGAVADLRIVRCRADHLVRLERVDGRGSRRAHADRPPGTRASPGEDAVPVWSDLEMGAPTLDVDTTDGYRPGLQAVIDFAAAPRSGQVPG